MIIWLNILFLHNLCWMICCDRFPYTLFSCTFQLHISVKHRSPFIIYQLLCFERKIWLVLTGMSFIQFILFRNHPLLVRILFDNGNTCSRRQCKFECSCSWSEYNILSLKRVVVNSCLWKLSPFSSLCFTLLYILHSVKSINKHFIVVYRRFKRPSEAA